MINIEKAKNKTDIEYYQGALQRMNIEYKDVLDRMSSYSYILNKQLLRKPENLHFDSEEDACTYFDDLVCDNAWDGNDEICNILVNCYVNGVLYRPVYYQREFDRGGCCIKMERVDD